MIEVKELKKIITKHTILDIPHLIFKEGKIIEVVGKNGSGKSTLLKIILNLIQPTHGKIFINNRPNDSDQSWKKNIGAYLDEGFLIDFLTPEEYFELIFRLRDISLAYFDDFVLQTQSLFANEILNKKKPIGNYSAGNKQKIGIAGALIGELHTLILDEPFSHLDQESKNELIKVLKDLNLNKGTTIIMTNHEFISTNIFFDYQINIQNGRIVEELNDTIH